MLSPLLLWTICIIYSDAPRLCVKVTDTSVPARAVISYVFISGRMGEVAAISSIKSSDTIQPVGEDLPDVRDPIIIFPDI